jgi:hypothetical protein
MTLYRFHKNRPVREILRQARWQRGADMVLDDANDATLDDLGRVWDRHSGIIADVSRFHGAARVSAALAAVSAHRA